MEIDLFGNVIRKEKEYIVEEKKINPFDLLRSISNKIYPESLKGFNKYLTNLGMSQRSDTVLFANEMNKNTNINDQMVFDFYYYGLPKKNYWASWAKHFKTEYTDSIKEYFEVSRLTARQYEKLLNEKQKQYILNWFETRIGGNNGNSNSSISNV